MEEAEAPKAAFCPNELAPIVPPEAGPPEDAVAVAEMQQSFQDLDVASITLTLKFQILKLQFKLMTATTNFAKRRGSKMQTFGWQNVVRWFLRANQNQPGFVVGLMNNLPGQIGQAHYIPQV